MENSNTTNTVCLALSKEVRNKVVDKHKSENEYKNISQASCMPRSTTKAIIKKVEGVWYYHHPFWIRLFLDGRTRRTLDTGWSVHCVRVRITSASQVLLIWDGKHSSRKSKLSLIRALPGSIFKTLRTSGKDAIVR